MQDQNQPFNPFNNQPDPNAPPQPLVEQQAAAPTPVTPEVSPVQPVISQDPTIPVAPLPPAQPQTPIQPTTELPPTPPKKGISKRLIIIIIALLVLIGGGIAGAALLLPNKTNNSSNATSSEDKETASSLTPAEKESISITDRKQLEEVCNGKKISNAKAVSGADYKIVGFQSRPSSDDWFMFGFSGTYESNYSYNLDSTNVILCMRGDDTTLTAAKTCTDVKDLVTNKNVSINYVGATYIATFYAAQTGEKLAEKSIVKSNETCPKYTTTTSILDGSVFAVPDEADINSALAVLLAGA